MQDRAPTLTPLFPRPGVMTDIYGNVLKQKAVPVSDVVDTTGAGDCFTAAFAVAMLEGKNDAEAMSYASECVGGPGWKREMLERASSIGMASQTANLHASHPWMVK